MSKKRKQRQKDKKNDYIKKLKLDYEECAKSLRHAKAEAETYKK